MLFAVSLLHEMCHLSTSVVCRLLQFSKPLNKFGLSANIACHDVVPHIRAGMCSIYMPA